MSLMQQGRLPNILRDTVVNLVRREGPDLTARQLGVILICYLEEGPHTVRGLAARLGVAKPAITRALDRLEEFQFARRLQDPRDRRSIVVARTAAGDAFMEHLRNLLDEASRHAGSPRTNVVRHLELQAAVG
ncbi:MAG: MarR family transcriptional regulator [Rhodospirillales bacterium]|nr:MarR family transcriptional regulator [Rhodospirillales bacterium]